MRILVIDTETTGLKGHPADRVLEIGISELNEETGQIIPFYNELIRYPDIYKFKDAWIFQNTTMTPDDVRNADKSLEQVVDEVREIVKNKRVTAYNVGFDYGKFLNYAPWNLQECYKAVAYDIMDEATELLKEMCQQNALKDKKLQKRLIWDWTDYPDKWVRSQDAYNGLCPDDPAKLRGKQTHRALDDTVMEAHIMRRVIEIRKKQYEEREKL